LKFYQYPTCTSLQRIGPFQHNSFLFDIEIYTFAKAQKLSRLRSLR